MLTFASARRLAEAWVQIVCGAGVEIVQEATIAKPYGWVFFYQSSAVLTEPGDFSDALVGNAPFLIDRHNGRIEVLGTAQSVADYLHEFENSLSPPQLHIAPEYPVW
jgi:hypothetical protein